MSDLLTVDEIAGKLRIAPRTLREWIAEKRFPAHKIGHDYRVSSRDYEKWLESRRVGAPAQK